MRNRLGTISVPKALQMLQQIKVGEMIVNGKSVTMATRTTGEHREILRKLGVKPIPSQFASKHDVV